jgi:methyl-accepting chemotaxis protein
MQKLRIAQKLSAIVVAVMLVVLVVVGVIAAGDINDIATDALDLNLRSQAQTVEELIDGLSREALQVATVLAEMPDVKAAYRAGDEVLGWQQMDKAVRPLTNRLTATLGIDETYRIHFHKPPAVSFYRSWTDRAGDDLSGFRATILEVERTGEALTTVELGRGGFVIRGIAPIFDGTDYLGSVEVYFQPTRVLPYLESEYRTGIVLLIDAAAAEALFFEEDYDRYFLGRVGESLVSAVSAEWIEPEALIDPARVAEVRESGAVVLDQRGDVQLAYIPLTDFSGSINGQLVSVIDVSGLRAAARGRILRLILVVVGLTIAGALLVLFFVTRAVTRPLVATADNLKQIAVGDGDLSLRMPETRSDEIGRLARHFNNFVANLSGIVASIQGAMVQLEENARQLDSATDETRESAASINTLVGNVAGQIREQDESISQSSASIEEITGNISSLERVIGHLSGSIDDSAASVEEMAANISSITRSLEQVDDYIGRLVSSSDHGRETIQLVTDRINEVVEQSEHLQQANQLIATVSAQTNLLAMNAAIEAAHAGEYGRGFAVVAEEIRNLAENSAAQSKIISGELKKTRDYIENAVAASKDADSAFGSVREMVRTVNDLEAGVRDALREQERAGESVMQNLHQMREMGGSVTGGISEISTGSGTILTEMSKLVEISRSVTGMMEEMAAGSHAIETAMAAIAEQSRHNSELVETVRREAGRFTV